MFRSLQGLLKKRIKGFSFQKDILALQVLDAYKEVVADIFDGNRRKTLSSKALFFKNNIIYVQTSNSIAAQELQLQKQRIIKEINKKLKEEAVVGIISKL